MPAEVRVFGKDGSTARAYGTGGLFGKKVSYINNSNNNNNNNNNNNDNDNNNLRPVLAETPHEMAL